MDATIQEQVCSLPPNGMISQAHQGTTFNHEEADSNFPLFSTRFLVLLTARIRGQIPRTGSMSEGKPLEPGGLNVERGY
jgi:hypothetical protein